MFTFQTFKIFFCFLRFKNFFTFLVSWDWKRSCRRRLDPVACLYSELIPKVWFGRTPWMGDRCVSRPLPTQITEIRTYIHASNCDVVDRNRIPSLRTVETFVRVCSCACGTVVCGRDCHTERRYPISERVCCAVLISFRCAVMSPLTAGGPIVWVASPLVCKQ
jgi:hypothetical protein